MAISQSDKVIDGLAASSKLSAETGHAGRDIKPCAASLLETPVNKGDSPDRSTSALFLACEFYRIDMDIGEAQRRLEIWNSRNNPPIKLHDLERALHNGYKGKYHYGCNHSVSCAYCIGTDSCPFHNHVLGEKRKFNFVDFHRYGWIKHLSSRQKDIYCIGLPYLERRRGVGAGGLIFANHTQIAEASGISRPRLKADLETLQSAGLIEYTPGLPLYWQGKSTEIRRVVPIPRPTHAVLEKLQGVKNVT